MRNPLELLTRSPLWAIRPEAVTLAVLQLIKYGKLDAAIEADRWEAAKPSLQGKGQNKIAVVPIQGVLSADGPAWYGSNYDTISGAVGAAANNPDVKRIVLSVDSPGGEVTGLPECAAVIAAARQQKPVSAMVEGMSASAAFWLTCMGSDTTVTPSGEVGSVGVRMMHMDVSKMLEDYGVKVTELYSGDFKTEWSPYKPLSEEAQADMKPRLAAAHQDFINAIDSTRAEKASADIRAARYGEGRMFGAPTALSNGMVDKIQSSRDFYRSLVSSAEDAPIVGFPSQRARLAIAVERAKQL
jgi:signal peptide peptidase SppA